MNSSTPGYASEGRYLWDPWFLFHEDLWHMWHLQSPRDGKPEERHHNHVSIGYATSRDLISWESRDVALSPGETGTWDDLSLWTGSTYLAHDMGYLFYTGRSRESFWKQQIGLATSRDLKVWEKHSGNPVLAGNTTYYQQSTSLNALGAPPAWRDPFVFQEDDMYYLLFSARVVGSQSEFNGCIGLARSRDLVQWEILPPLLSPGRYDEMEVPQLITYQEKHYLFFHTFPKYYKPQWMQEVKQPGYGLHCYVADSFQGAYAPVNNGTGIVPHYPDLYGLRLLDNQDGQWRVLGWQNMKDGTFIGRLSVVLHLLIDNDTVRFVRS